MAKRSSLDKWQKFWRSARAGSPALTAASAAGYDRIPLTGEESGDWAASSVDLLRGADVTEYPDTVTDALLDELFRPQARGAAGPAG